MSWEPPSGCHAPAEEWPLHAGGLDPSARWWWYQQLWGEVCALQARFRLPVRSGWWEDEIQVEALAALAVWLARYDSGAWDDPPGKLALLYDLDRIAVLLRDGGDPFVPERDRAGYVRHLLTIDCRPPPS